VPLAVVNAIVKGEILSARYMLFRSLHNLCVGNDFIVKPFLKRIGGNGEDSIGKPVLAIFFLPDSLLMLQK
jgi:hypothetical protein